MNWRNIRTVYFKEMLDTLRDKRTLISSVIVSLLLFPLMTIGFGTVAAKAVKSLNKESISVMLLGETNAPAMFKRLANTQASNSKNRRTTTANASAIRNCGRPSSSRRVSRKR